MSPTQFRILFAVLGVGLLCDTIVGSRLKVRDAFDHAQSRLLSPDAFDHPQSQLLSPGSLSIRTFQWNGGKKDLTYEVEEIFEKRDDTADVIAFCMTEATPEKEVHTIVEERGLSDTWALVGYGKHTGLAGGVFNSQILSVFLRQPTEKPYAVNADPIVAKKGSGWGAAGWQSDYISEKTQISGVLSSKTMLHQTSHSGKGAVSTVLSFDRVSNFEKTSVALICAHLDSEDTDDRRKGLIQILDEVSRDSSGDDAKFEGLPCAMFDSPHEKCSVSRSTPARPLNSVLLMGDLNFRLRWLKDDGTTAPFPKRLNEPTPDELRLDDLFTADGRKTMSLDDPLNPAGTSPEILVQDAPDGFAFLCDVPYDWLPSYKRNGPEACVKLAKHLRGCGQLGALGPRDDAVSLGNCSDAQVADLAAACFKDKKKGWKLKTEKKQPIKKRSLQLGWLDRVCFRSVGDEPMSFKIRDAYHWDDHIYEKDELSDHTPVEMLLTITNKHGMCPLQPNHLSSQVEEADTLLSLGSALPKVTRTNSEPVTPAYRWLEASRSYVTESEKGVHAECPDGFHFDVTPPDDASPDKQELKCQGGSLKTLDEIDTKDLMCKRYCGPLKTPENGKRLDEASSAHPRAAPFVTGAKSRFACEEFFYVLSGTALQTCGPDGKYGEDAESLRCLRTCGSVSELQSDLGEHGTVSLQRSPANKISEEDKVAEGDQVIMRCNGRTLSDGLSASTLTCTDSGKYDRPVPKCLATCGDPPDVNSTSKLAVGVKSSLTGKVTPWKTGTKVFEGDVIEFSCIQGSLQGVEKFRCESDGMYEYHASEARSVGRPQTKFSMLEPPVCRVECAAPPMPTNSAVVSSGASSNGDSVAGSELHYSCKEGCAMLGDSKIKCTNEGVFDKEPPRCVCDATLHLDNVHFEGIDMKEVNTMKLKLYPRSLDDKAGSGQKGYDKKSYQKLSPEEFHDLDFRLDHDLTTFFFHVELCASSISNWLTLHSSRCETIAISDELPEDDATCPSCFGTVVQQVSMASSASKTHELVLPVSGKGVSDTGSVKLTFRLPGR